MAQKFSNGARALLAATINNTDTAFSIESGGALFPVANTGASAISSAADWFKLVIQDQDGYEIVYVRTHTSASNNFSNVLRGQEGTTARGFTAGATVGLRPTAGDADHVNKTDNPHGVTKAQVGLGNVDNTSDANKPISTATQTALDGKANTSHGHAIANVTGLQDALDALASSGVNLTVAPKTAPYSVVSGDKGSRLELSGGADATFASAAALGAGWYCTVANTGSTDVSLIAHASESIAGAASYVLHPGQQTLIHSDGSALGVLSDTRRVTRRLAIFSAAAASARPVSVGEDVTFGRMFPIGLVNGPAYTNRANGLFLMNSSNSDSNVATSADGETWTLRSMPAAKKWRIAVDGSNLLACAAGDTSVAISTDSITWSAATALPGNSSTLNNVPPAGIGGTWLVSGGGANVYRSTNHGSTWSTVTLPANLNLGIFRVNGRFVFTSGSTGYYSSTGETGSWTSFALPVQPGLTWVDTDGTVLFSVNSAGAQVYQFDSHDSASEVTGVALQTVSIPVFSVNGVRVCFNSPWGYTKTFHDSGPVVRQSSVNVQSLSAATDGTRWVIPYGGGALALTEATSQTALFD